MGVKEDSYKNEGNIIYGVLNAMKGLYPLKLRRMQREPPPACMVQKGRDKERSDKKKKAEEAEEAADIDMWKWLFGFGPGMR